MRTFLGVMPMKYRMTLVKIGIKKGFASKYALVFWLFSSLISVVVQYFLWQAVLVKRPAIVFRQTLSYLILMQLLTVLFPKTSYDLNDKVRSGDIAIDLLKPLSVSTQLLWESVGYSLTKFATIGIVDVFIYLWLMDFQISLAAVFMVTVTAILAYFLYFELELTLGTLTFYTYSIWGISTFKEAVLLVLAGNIFPVNFYPSALKILADHLPFQYSFGAVGMLAENPSWQLFSKVALVQIAYILLFCFLSKLLFRHAVASTVIQGG